MIEELVYGAIGFGVLAVIVYILYILSSIVPHADWILSIIISLIVIWIFGSVLRTELTGKL